MMDCGIDLELDAATGTNDDMSGFLTRLVDQSITDLIEEDHNPGEVGDEETPLPNIKENKSKFVKTKSLPTLDMKKMDGMPRNSTPIGATASLPNVKRKSDSIDMCRNTLIKQYKKAIGTSHTGITVIREEPETRSRNASADDLFRHPDVSTAHDASHDTEYAETKHSGSDEEEIDVEDMDLQIGNFISNSLSSIVGEQAAEKPTVEEGDDNDNLADDIIESSHCSIMNDTAATEAVKETEREHHEDEKEVSLDGSVSPSGSPAADKEPCAKIAQVLEAQAEGPVTDSRVEIASERKTSSGGVFAFLFKRKKSKGSLKLRSLFSGFACCVAPQVDDDTSTDAGEARKPSKKVKKPGFLKRLFPCLKNRSGRVAPLEKGD